ncbi:MAG TPA: hypothetical protein VLB67_07655 [Acidimicrobiia bacterium]|nr:hypothetical protein [Acidimicrobiia bacterium]
MKNVWKGLTVGAFAGAAVGILIDVVEVTGRRAAEASSRAASGVSTRAKSGATHLAELVEEKLDDWDVKDKVEHAVDQAKESVEQAVDKGVDARKRR